MADYPSFDQLSSSTIKYKSGNTVDEMDDGTVRTVRKQSALKRIFNIEHLLTKDELDTLISHYNGWDGNPFNFYDQFETESGQLPVTVVYGEDAISDRVWVAPGICLVKVILMEQD